MSQYTVIQPLGAGAQGEAVLCRGPGGLCVIKKIPVSPSARQASTELSLLKRLRSPYVIRYLDAFYSTSHLNIVTEYADYGNLERQVRLKAQTGQRLSEHIATKLAFQTLSALAYLHGLGIVHRDVKPENILLKSSGDDIVFTLCDLGVAKEGVELNTAVGTPLYLSPQICKGQAYGPKTDIWSLGATLYRALALRHPFEDPSVVGVFRRICDGKYRPLEGVSRGLTVLVNLCLTVAEAERPSAQQLLACSLFDKFRQEQQVKDKAQKALENQNIDKQIMNHRPDWNTQTAQNSDLRNKMDSQ